MIENLLELVREHSGESIVNNPAIPNEKNEIAISETAHGILDTLKSQITGGNSSHLMSLFNGENVSGHPLIQQIIQAVSSRLTNKAGIDTNSAQNILSDLIPKIMRSFVNKTNNPDDHSFTLNNILSGLGSQSGGFGDMLNSVKGMFEK